MLYKIQNNLVDIVSHMYLVPNTRDTRVHNAKIFVPSSRINAYKTSFFQASIVLWNSAPYNIVHASSTAELRTQLASTRVGPGAAL